MTNTTTISERVEQLKQYIDEGKILEAMNEFYHDDVVMQENSETPTEGLAANIEREKQFLSIVKRWNWWQRQNGNLRSFVARVTRSGTRSSP